MYPLDKILANEMLKEDTESIMADNNDSIDGFFPAEDEAFCNSILSDDDDDISDDDDIIVSEPQTIESNPSSDSQVEYDKGGLW